MPFTQASGMDSPASNAFAITPHDTNNLTTHTRALFIGSSGNLVVTLVGDSTAVTFTNISPGYHPLRVKKVAATGTTCSGIVGLA
jgi:hypothetical protein